MRFLETGAIYGAECIDVMPIDQLLIAARRKPSDWLSLLERESEFPPQAAF